VLYGREMLEKSVSFRGAFGSSAAGMAYTRAELQIYARKWQPGVINLHGN